MLTVGASSWTWWQTCSGVACRSSRTASSTSWRCGVIRSPRACSVLRRAARSAPLLPPSVLTPSIVGRPASLSRVVAMRVVAMLDGTLSDPDQPVLKVEDLGLMRGDGVFETVLVVDGRARELEPHLNRLARSAAMLDLPAPDLDAWRRAARTVIDAWTGSAEFVLKLVYTRGVEGADQ